MREELQKENSMFNVVELNRRIKQLEEIKSVAIEFAQEWRHANEPIHIEEFYERFIKEKHEKYLKKERI